MKFCFRLFFLFFASRNSNLGMVNFLHVFLLEIGSNSAFISFNLNLLFHLNAYEYFMRPFYVRSTGLAVNGHDFEKKKDFDPLPLNRCLPLRTKNKFKST